MSNRQTIQISQPKLNHEELAEVEKTLNSGWLTQGPQVEQFEKNFAQYHNVEHAITVTSCTTGLHLALLALNIREGDEVIVPAFTWVATANVVVYCGAKPVLVDVDPHTYNIDINDLAKKLTDKTKAIIPVHLFGLCADIDAIKKIAPDVAIIEDAACASGSRYKNKFAGGLGDLAVFSFHPRKIITTGEGGMITTNNSELAEKIRQLRNHGASISEEQRHFGSKPYLLAEFNEIGYNYRMTDLQAAVGKVQLTKLTQFVEERQHWANFYNEQLRHITWLRVPEAHKDYLPSWQAYVCFVDETKTKLTRNQIMEILFEKKISTRPGTHALHMLGVYKDLYGYNENDFPGARDCANFTLALPLHNKMNPEDYTYIVETINSIGA